MSKKYKINKRNLTYTIFVIIFLIIISLIILAFTLQKTQINNFYDKELGWISTKITTNNMFFGWLTSLFGFLKQSVTFSQTTAIVNDTIITLTENYNVSGLSTATTTGYICKISSFEVVLHTPTGDKSPWGTVSLTSPIGNFESVSHQLTFKASSVGTYSATTNYYEVRCSIGTGSCSSNSECSKSWSLDSTNNVTVNAAPSTTCSQQNYREPATGYASDSDSVIDHGVVGTADYHVFTPPECEDIIDHSDYQTTCDDGYHCESLSDSDNICPIATGCVANSHINTSQNCLDNPDIITCTSPQVCDNITKECVSIECNENQNLTCNGTLTNIVKIVCSNGTFIPIDPIPTCPNNTNNQNNTNNTNNNTTICTLPLTKTCPDNTTIIEKNCVNGSYVNTNLNCSVLGADCFTLKTNISQTELGKQDCTLVHLSSVSKCDNLTYFDTNIECIAAQPEIDYILWGMIIGSIILVMIIVIIIMRIKK